MRSVTSAHSSSTMVIWGQTSYRTSIVADMVHRSEIEPVSKGRLSIILPISRMKYVYMHNWTDDSLRERSTWCSWEFLKWPSIWFILDADFCLYISNQPRTTCEKGTKNLVKLKLDKNSNPRNLSLRSIYLWSAHTSAICGYHFGS